MKKLIIASSFALFSLAAATSAEAACRQVFSHTTCTGLFRNNCTNHFKQQCDAPAARMVAPPPQSRLVVQPNVGSNRSISDQGGGLISNNRGGILSNANGGLVSDRGGAVVPTNAGRLR
jgi:hypothetical protein